MEGELDLGTPEIGRRTPRGAGFQKAAELLSGPWRARLNAATMLGQSKTSHPGRDRQRLAELIDFWRFNPCTTPTSIHDEQPPYSPEAHLEPAWSYRPLDGFVFAVTPFNFTSIAGNLPTSSGADGQHRVLWKPATTATLSAWHVMQPARGLGPAARESSTWSNGPRRPRSATRCVSNDRRSAGVHFTGSTGVFQHMWKTIGNNIASYRSYPRIVGETGGKDFVFAHPSADVVALSTALVRGAFEYQGQKCSAASRAYIPESLWPQVVDGVRGHLEQATMGPVTDLSNFLSAVIDAKSFRNIKSYLDDANGGDPYEVIAGGKADDAVGWFVEPTVVRSSDPKARLMQEEIFGPVLTCYVYPDGQLEETLDLCDGTSPYALTGAIFAQDRRHLVHMAGRLRHAAGNFYLNDKPTGAVVGQQPFGGGRASGTNDKAGSATNLLRWVSMRSMKETFAPPTSIRYPHMD